jgi:hypothetical protein
LSPILAGGDCVRLKKELIRERTLAVIDVRDNAKVANKIGRWHGGRSPSTLETLPSVAASNSLAGCRHGE